jgi:hypothetical protein
LGKIAREFTQKSQPSHFACPKPPAGRCCVFHAQQNFELVRVVLVLVVDLFIY